MTDFIRVACAQIDLTVGDIEGNEARITTAMVWAEDCQADLLLLPELAITGYPPEDLVLRKAFVDANLAALHRLAAKSGGPTTVVGYVDRVAPDRSRDDAGPPRLHNAAALLSGGRVRGIYHKALLPNYGVFDEDRYFMPGVQRDALWEINGVIVGVSVCEDIWVSDGPPSEQAAAGADVLVNINGSPYHMGRGAEREAMLRSRAIASGLPLVYLNLIGGQDELVFDGQSMVFTSDGTLLYRAPQFQEEMFWIDVPLNDEGASDVNAIIVSRGDLLEGEPDPPPLPSEPLDAEAEIYQALCLGLSDYVRKNGFTGVVLGLSGGIDSALTAAIAADALGPDAVWGVTMPGRYSSVGSVEDSRTLAANLGIRFDEISIELPFSGYLDTLDEVFADRDAGLAGENLQARTRGAILMALSNEFGGMVVATGNKSEMAVGYATLYGDMAGGYAVLKDVFKTQVYDLSRWRNQDGEVIPQAIIDKAPSAELRPDQLDTDSLPDYALLDRILESYVEDDMSVDAIVKQGFDRSIVERVARMVDTNEYKRRQAAPGVRISTKALGRDRRLPITNGWSGG
ncbi:NAD+ synthase [bacterium]|nr:NAD+ synthase [bacterium]